MNLREEVIGVRDDARVIERLRDLARARALGNGHLDGLTGDDGLALVRRASGEQGEHEAIGHEADDGYHRDADEEGGQVQTGAATSLVRPRLGGGAPGGGSRAVRETGRTKGGMRRRGIGGGDDRKVGHGRLAGASPRVGRRDGRVTASSCLRGVRLGSARAKVSCAPWSVRGGHRFWPLDFVWRRARTEGTGTRLPCLPCRALISR